MDGFELNKIASSILLVGVIVMLVSVFTDVLYEPTLAPTTRGYSIELDDSNDKSQPNSIASNSVDSIADLDEKMIEDLIKNASVEAGSKIFKSKCSTCHTNAPNAPNKVGPNLHDVVGRTKAQHQGYNYSSAMLAQQGNWDKKSLFLYLHKPNRYVSGTKMTFIGLAKQEDIANVIKFLEDNASK